jgi:ABC-type uncharacterized transport system substrate-binding protein
MTQKIFAFALGALLFALSLPAEAQQLTKKIPVIGVLRSQLPSANPAEHEALLQGLRERGYVEGKNIAIEYRSAEGKLDRFPELAAELVRLRVDVILVGGGGATAAAKQATNTIPIVAISGELVKTGIVASLAKPRGNITGLTNVDSDFSAKRMELLKEAIPKLSRVAVLSYDSNRPTLGGALDDLEELRETRAAAQSLGARIQSVEVKDSSEFESAFGAMTKQRAQALIITNNNFNFIHRKQLVQLAAKNRLPTMWGQPVYVEDGGLMAYAASRIDSLRRAAIFIDKILKGAKPADLLLSNRRSSNS